MRNYYSPVSGIALLAWLGGWLWWLSGEYQYCEAKALQQAPQFKLRHGALHYTGEEVISFAPSTAIPRIEPAHYPFLEQVSQYLRTSGDAHLHLTGLCASFEKNRTSFDNLGAARSNAIGSLLVAAGAPPEKISSTGAVFDNLLLHDGSLFGAVLFRFSAEGAQRPVRFQEIPTPEPEDRTLYFPEGRYELYDAKGQAGPVLDSLLDALSANGNFRLDIVGFANSAEAQLSQYNLAALRARSVRYYLFYKGADRRRVNLRFVLHACAQPDYSKVELHLLPGPAIE